MEHVLLERAHHVGPAWRRHYDRLHLHTSRGFSGLPHHPMPPHYPRYPSREQVVEYLEDYVRAMDLKPALDVTVSRVERDGEEWLVQTASNSIRCSAVVMCTGVNGSPKRPTWPGMGTFPGRVLHSSEYRNGSEFRDSDVLVIGFGNSGGEIALDLVEHGARPTVSVRSAVNIIPRDILGVPVLGIAIPLSKLPPRLADFLIRPILKAYYPSYRRLGLRKARFGPFRQIRKDGRIPLLDVGTVGEIERGAIRIEGNVEEIEGATVRFDGGGSRGFDAMVLATGYEPAFPEGITWNGTSGPRTDVPGLYFCGYYVSPTGMLREIGLEAQAIVDRIAGAGE